MRRTTGKPRGTREQRFRHYAPSTGDGCWEWTGHRNDKGYGVMRTGPSGASRLERAHRIAWELANGPIPNGIQVLHHCDNPPCVRPDHLWLGTNADNMRDRDHKGRLVRPPGDLRHYVPKGEETGSAKVTADDIPDIRRRWAAGETYRSLAKHYRVHPTTIGAIVTRKAWKHIP